MSVPQSPILLNFMKVVNAYQPNDIAPAVIHCRYDVYCLECVEALIGVQKIQELISNPLVE